MIQGTLALEKSGADDGAEFAGEFDARIVQLHGGMMDRALAVVEEVGVRQDIGRMEFAG